jgi:hypothetical protein
VTQAKRFWCAKVESAEQFQAYCDHMPDMYGARHAAELALAPPKGESTYIEGRCDVCEKPSRFFLDWTHAFDYGPNFRESMICEGCRLNTRMRGTLEFIRDVAELDAHARIYAMEQITPLFVQLKARYANLTGSEYLRDGTGRGQVNAQGVRHEDVTALTFPARTFDGVISLEVLEHVPDYRAALRETFRVLKHGGRFVLTAPFNVLAARTLVRAAIVDGQVVHHEPPEYHGDPVSADDGALCFYHFGWDLVEELRDVGFRDAALHFYWSRERCYLGGFQFIIMAVK